MSRFCKIQPKSNCVMHAFLKCTSGQIMNSFIFRTKWADFLIPGFLIWSGASDHMSKFWPKRRDRGFKSDFPSFSKFYSPRSSCLAFSLPEIPSTTSVVPVLRHFWKARFSLTSLKEFSLFSWSFAARKKGNLEMPIKSCHFVEDFPIFYKPTSSKLQEKHKQKTIYYKLFHLS